MAHTEGGGKLVLILAKDEPGVDALERALLDHGLNVVQASPAATLTLLADLEPDLILVDPSELDPRAAEGVHSSEAFTFALVSSPSPENLRMAMRIGAMDFLVRPLSDEGVEEAEHLLSTYRSTRRRAVRQRKQEGEASWRLKREIQELKECYLQQSRALDDVQDLFYLDLSRMMTIFDNIMDGILFVDPEGQITLINPKAEAYLGVKSFVAIGRPLEETRENQELVQEILRGHLKAKEDYVGTAATLEIPVKKGDFLYLEARTTGVRDYNGSFAGMLTVIKDVTAEQKSDQMKNRYLSIVSHELRTPLTGIKTFATMLGKGVLGKLPEKQQRVVDSIREQSLRLEHEIDKLISLGRIESGDFALDREVFPIIELLDQILLPFEAVAEERGIKLDRNIAETHELVHADRDDLRRAIQALVENALKFTNEGGQVVVSLTEKDDLVEISVQDNGPGIDSKYQKRIFEKFFQIENPLTRQHGGAGLGLSVAKGVAEAHGGQLEFESEPGKGSDFRVWLPVWTDSADKEGCDVGPGEEPLCLDSGEGQKES